MCSQFALRAALLLDLQGVLGQGWIPWNQTCASALLHVGHRLLSSSHITGLGMDALEVGLHLAS